MDPTLVIAVCALIVSVASTALATWTAYVQRKHMRLSVKPIAAFPVTDFENSVGVFLQNKGLGPLRVANLKVVDADGTEFPDLVSHMPSLEPGVLWANFHQRTDGAVVEAGKRLELLLLVGEINHDAFVPITKCRASETRRASNQSRVR